MDDNDRFNDAILLTCTAVMVLAFGVGATRIGWVAIAVGGVAMFGGWRK